MHKNQRRTWGRFYGARFRESLSKESLFLVEVRVCTAEGGATGCKFGKVLRASLLGTHSPSCYTNDAGGAGWGGLRAGEPRLRLQPSVSRFLSP